MPETQVRMEIVTAKALTEFAEARGLSSRGDAAAILIAENKMFYRTIGEDITSGTLSSGLVKMLDSMIVSRIKDRGGASVLDLVSWAISLGITIDVVQLAKFIESRLDKLSDDGKIETVFTVGEGSFWAVPSECDKVE